MEAWRLEACRRVMLALALVFGATVWPRAQNGELVVSAAASLADVMTELTTLYRDEARVAVRVNTGGSNTLARQIVEGARVDVFVSADQSQMDIAERAGRIVPGSRTNLLTNQLVIIVPGGGADRLRQGSGESRRSASAKADPPPLPEATWPTITNAKDLAAPAVRRIAMGNPESVPAGVYGKRWLEHVGVWPLVAPKVIPLPTVRAALSAVQEGRVDAGIVYATDARVATAVRVAVTAPNDDAPAVVYPAAAIRGGQEQAASRFLAWLREGAATRVFGRAGFGMAGSSPILRW